ncbi:MAG: GntR family transcriptional regulator [Nannocystaceae bacterium]|nr:GntR family transcriptional regulator [bacterium]
MFELKRDRGNPVYLQIQAQIERRIASGALCAGDVLPSVRTLAKQLRVNPNTVVRAYRELEFRDLVETRHGEGTFVAAGAEKQAQPRALLAERAREFVHEAKELGLTKEQALAAVKSAWRSSGKPGKSGQVA